MTVGYLQKQQELLQTLSQGLEMQQALLNGLKTALQDYQEFLADSLSDFKEVE